MSRTTLQIPLDSNLRDKAEKVANQAGFSSLQEVVRIFLHKFAQQNITVNFYEKDVKLTSESETRYIPMVNDAVQGKNIIKPHSVNDLVSLLD